MEMLTGEVNELMNLKTCSPFMIYIVMFLMCLFKVYYTRLNLKRYNTNKMDNLYNYYSMGEFRFMSLIGLVLYGLCSYNKEFLAWLVLLLPVLYVLLQNIITQIYIVSAYQGAPVPVMEEKKTDSSGGTGGRILAEMSAPKPSVLTPPMSTNTSELLGGSAGGGLGGITNGNQHNIF